MNNPTRARITDLSAALRYVYGGNAVFTLVSKKTGTRFTFRARRGHEDDFAFVDLLTGPDNVTDFQFIGTALKGRGFRRSDKGAVPSDDVPSILAITFFFQLRAHLPEMLEFWHEGRCSRCGKRLTDPKSIEIGLGPWCRTKI